MPQPQQLKLSPQQLVGIMIQDLFQSQVQTKEMMVVKSSADYEEAVSTFHEDTHRKYGLKVIKNEEKIVFELWVPIPGTNELQHREMLVEFKDIFGILIQHKLQNSLQLADLMYSTIDAKSIDEWEQIVDRVNKKSSIILP